MDALKRMREGVKAKKGTERKRVKSEMSQLYKSKKTRAKCPWRHKFVCLAYTDQSKMPATEFDKDELLQAGLGEKELLFDDIEISQEEFKEAVVEA